MTNQKTTEDRRILNEMLEMAHALQGHALITKQDMAKMNLLAKVRPSTPQKT